MTASDIIVDSIFFLQVGGTTLVLGQGLSQITRGRVSIAKVNNELCPETVSCVFLFALPSFQ